MKLFKLMFVVIFLLGFACNPCDRAKSIESKIMSLEKKASNLEIEMNLSENEYKMERLSNEYSKVLDKISSAYEELYEAERECDKYKSSLP